MSAPQSKHLPRIQNLHSGDVASCIGWLITKKRPTSLVEGERHRWWLQANLGPWAQAAPAWPGEGLDDADNGGGELTRTADVACLNVTHVTIGI